MTHATHPAEVELRALKVATVAMAHQMSARMCDSAITDIAGLRVQVRVKRERHHGKEALFARWRVGGRGIGENALLYNLRRRPSDGR